MKTLVLTFTDACDFNAAVTCPQDTNLFKTFNNEGDFIIWLDNFMNPDKVE